MQYIFSPDKKFSTWRKLWIALAESEQELGLDITDKQIAQMKEHIYDINYDVAKEQEKRCVTTLCRTFTRTAYSVPTRSR